MHSTSWFWDKFPKLCNVLWYFFMAAALVVTYFWRDPLYAWFASHWVISFILGLFSVLLLVVGNLIPGIPNMFAPLFTGWALAAGMNPYLAIILSLLMTICATAGSLFGYMYGEDNGIIGLRKLRLNDSARYQIAENIIRYDYYHYPILKSRIGKWAALCGHVNIAAGVNNYGGSKFALAAGCGHFLWTAQYMAVGFAISWLVPKFGQFF